MKRRAWQFKTTRAAFNGSRVCDEAREAGIEIFTVGAGPYEVTFYSEAFAERLRKAGAGVVVECGSYAPEWHGSFLGVTYSPVGYPYTYRGHAITLIDTLESAEKASVTVRVEGWGQCEEGSDE